VQEDEASASDEDLKADESDDDDNESSSPITPPASATVDRVKYHELHARAQKYPGGEKRLKQAIIQHAAERMEEYVHAGATDNRCVKAI